MSDVLDQLAATLAQRRQADPEQSYVASLHHKGLNKILEKVGEEATEVRGTIEDIREAGVEILTIGQYLQPTSRHLPVDRWVHPDEFAEYRSIALELGFDHCESGPLVRSSYHAHEHVQPVADVV